MLTTMPCEGNLQWSSSHNISCGVQTSDSSAWVGCCTIQSTTLCKWQVHRVPHNACVGNTDADAPEHARCGTGGRDGRCPFAPARKCLAGRPQPYPLLRVQPPARSATVFLLVMRWTTQRDRRGSFGFLKKSCLRMEACDRLQELFWKYLLRRFISLVNHCVHMHTPNAMRHALQFSTVLRNQSRQALQQQCIGKCKCEGAAWHKDSVQFHRVSCTQHAWKNKATSMDGKAELLMNQWSCFNGGHKLVFRTPTIWFTYLKDSIMTCLRKDRFVTKTQQKLHKVVARCVCPYGLDVGCSVFAGIQYFV